MKKAEVARSTSSGQPLIKKAEVANFPEFEQEMLKVWDKENTFEKSLEQRKGQKRFRFYDGPPFTSGPPHYGHLEQSSLKDAVARYKTMRGYYVPRRTGADTHGLPIENLVEKEHDFATKKDIVAFGIEKFNAACRAIVFRHKSDFDHMYRRLGRWDDPETTYATLDDDYIESVWRVFANLNEKGLVYRGFKSMPYCPRCATPLSNFEVNDGYKDDVPDPSVYVKFELADHSDTSLLVWTTTPWTLPANAALAVSAEADYIKLELSNDGDGWKQGERLILAKERLSVLDLKQAEYKVIGTMKGRELAGGRYLPLYQPAEPLAGAEQVAAWQVYVDPSVSLEDGTGILHVSPRYGEADLAIGQREGLPLLESVDGAGMMVEDLKRMDGLTEVAGVFFKKADSHIIADLTQKGRVFAAETFTHTYPFCWRCETPLLYFAMPSWFVAVSQLRDKLVETGKEVNWIPAHVKPGRFLKWLEGARDWAISRNRFWGAPIPVWVNEADEDDRIVVGSLDELRSLSRHTGDFDLHRPGIDQIVIKRDGKTYRRIEEVFDCWFESGSMPYGQGHYPFEGKEAFEASFPADFVCEAIEQVHLWFYTLHVLAVAQFDKPAYKNVVATGLILGADGRKLSKRLRNYPPVEDVFDQFGADVLRFFILGSPLMIAGDTRLSQDALQDINRNIFMTLWNVVSFFTMYAEIDLWQPTATLELPKGSYILDAWMLARVDEATSEITKAGDEYQISRAVEPLNLLIDDLSNWYVRRSRRRFWKNDDEQDKAQAYLTLHYVLLRISQLLAPWAPFVSDKIWRDLTEGMDVPSSVHLSDWPEVSKPNQDLINQMAKAREIVTIGLSQRAAAGIKVRQPLSEVVITGYPEMAEQLADVVADELNVKKVVQKDGKEINISLNTEITQELKLEGLAREVVRLVQSKRKEANLEVDDQIELTLGISGELAEAAQLHRDLIVKEALASKMTIGKPSGTVVPIRLVGQDVTVELTKV